MSEHPLKSFIELVRFDRDLSAIEKKLHQHDQEQQDLANQVLQLEQTEEQAQTRLRTARKEVDEKELEMKEVDEQLKKEKERLDEVTTTKQYQAIKKEIEGLKQRQNDLDEALLVAWNAFEAAQKDQTSMQQDLERRRGEIQAAKEALEKDVVELQAQHAALREARPEKEKTVPEEWLERYQAMRSRVSDPVVPVVSGSCSACFWAIPNQDLLQLKKKAVLQCKGCYRFLYMPDEETDQGDGAE